jgi:hypothetical protein
LIYELLLLLQFRDAPPEQHYGAYTWLMSDVGNGGPDVGIVHQLLVRLTLGTKLAAGVGRLEEGFMVPIEIREDAVHISISRWTRMHPGQKSRR